MSLREDILQAKKVANWYPALMPTEFVVISSVPDSLFLKDKQYWIEGCRPGGRLPRNAHEAAIIDRLRRLR